MHTATASIAYGYSLDCIRLQPRLHAVTASIAYGNRCHAAAYGRGSPLGQPAMCPPGNLSAVSPGTMAKVPPPRQRPSSQLLRLLRARLAALGGSAPRRGAGQATGRAAAASGARASRITLQRTLASISAPLTHPDPPCCRSSPRTTWCPTGWCSPRRGALRPCVPANRLH